jgi:dipeptidyl aminopeptidase/acylaminoacyl peptidase
MRDAKATLCVVLIATVLAACSDGADVVAPADNATADVPRYSAHDFYDTTTYTMVGSAAHAFSPDGQYLLISSDASGVFNAYELPVAGGAPQMLTDSDDNAIFAVSWFPDDRRVLYTYDGGGNELNHIIVREEDGSYRDLTPGAELKAGFVGWSADGAHFYLTSTERDQRNFDVYRYAVDGYAREMVFENAGFQVSDVSGDGRWLALDRPRTSADSDIYVVDLSSADAEPTLITEHAGNVAYSAWEFTPDNESLIYSTNEFGEFSQAWSYHLASGSRALVHAAEWDVSYVSSSPGGRYRVRGVNADARTDVSLVESGTEEQIELPALPMGDLRSVRFSADEKRIALIVNGDDSPSNIFLIDLDKSSAAQLTNAISPAISTQHLVRSDIVRYPSFDGLEIPAVLYRPKSATAENKVPALVWVHGGPGGQSRTGYSATRQHLVNHGYALLAANNRGSSGYGKTFFHLDDRRHGEEDLQDIVYGRKYLESLDWVDDERIGIIGGSYGGYMVAAALAFEPEVFDVGVNIFGVTNWVRTLESIPPWWESFKESLYDEMGDPAVDAERHRRISPLFHADNIVRPMLVVQGANDPRVLQVESDELVAAVQANEVPVEYVVFPDEGHGFVKRENRIAASEAYVKFLDKHLKRAAMP